MSKLPELIKNHQVEIQSSWLKHMDSQVRRADLVSDSEMQEQTRELLAAIAEGARSGDLDNVEGEGWDRARELMQSFSVSRAQQGLNPTETATFVLSLKRPLFDIVRRELVKTPEALFEEIWTITRLLDRLALLTAEAFLATREKMITQQQQEMMELSTPVVKLWEGILALPVIGTLDSSRTQVVMENLLQTVVATNSKYPIIHITGVPTRDTLLAQQLLKTITAARLMGAECIISGVRPQIAQTIVHLGINLEDVTTRARLSDAFALALQMSGRTVVRQNASAAGSKVVLAGPLAKQEG